MVLRGSAAREMAARAAAVLALSAPLPGKTLLRVFRDPHTQHIDAAAFVENGTFACLLVDDRTALLAEDHAVAGRGQLRRRDKWSLNLGCLEHDSCSLPFVCSEVHGLLADVRHSVALGDSIAAASF